MHVLTVIANELSPEHLLAAIKHWAAKFEQEILHKDMGPSDRGVYEFEHDGKPTEVHWNPAATVNHMQPSDPAGAVETPPANSDPVPSAYANEEPLKGGAMDPEAGAAINEAIAGAAARLDAFGQTATETAADVAASVAPDLA